MSPKVSKTFNAMNLDHSLNCHNGELVLNQSILAGHFFGSVFGEPEYRMFVVLSKLDW